MKTIKLLAPFLVCTLGTPTIFLVGCNDKPRTDVPVEGIEFKKSEAGCSLYDKFSLEYTIEPFDATDKSVTWSSSDTNKATVDNNGVITAHRPGITTITVKTNDGGFSSSCTLKISIPLYFEKSGLTTDPDPTISYATKGTTGGSIDIEISNDGKTWRDWYADDKVTIGDGQKLYVRNTKDTLSRDGNNNFRFKIADKNWIKASGNVDSMINYSDITKGCYYFMFYGCYGLTKAPDLPSTQLADDCYANMFGYCYGLGVAPALPATTLSNACYFGMFTGCISLLATPTLKADRLAKNCYHNMFCYCKELCVKEDDPGLYGELIVDFTNIDELPENATENMFDKTGGPFIGNPQAGHEYYLYIE